MYYSLVCFLALATLLIINHDVLFGHGGVSAKTQRVYRRFLYGVAAYHTADLLWAILDHYSIKPLLFAEVTFYFGALAASVLFWTQYVVEYLDRDNAFRRILPGAGWAFFAGTFALVLVNFVHPVLFWLDERGGYQVGPARYALLAALIALLLLTVIHALITASRTEDRVRARHYTIGLSGLIMLFFISIQIFFPLLPLYTVAYMLGCCLLRSFVVEQEKNEYRLELEKALENEKRHLRDLVAAQRIAFTDPLTQLGSKSAYARCVQKLQARLDKGESLAFALAMFDCNNLKQINDNHGHCIGDEYLKASGRLICSTFPDCPAFRIGGDEFAALLTGEALSRKDEMIREFRARQPELFGAVRTEKNFLSIAVGLAVFDPVIDYSIDDVLRRADEDMYRDKHELKSKMGVQPAGISVPTASE